MLSRTGLSPISPSFPAGSANILGSAGPRSLAATDGVSVDFLSSGYLDVSVPRVRSFNPMDSGQKYLSQPQIIDVFPDAPSGLRPKPAKGRRGACVFARAKTPNSLTIEDCQVGFPIRTSRDQRVLSPPPGLSQSATSFIASCCQGIHQTPFSRLIRSGRRQALLCGFGVLPRFALLEDSRRQPAFLAPVSEVLTRWRPSAGAPRFGDPNGLAARRTSRSVY
jgi:hypothetical protein